MAGASTGTNGRLRAQLEDVRRSASEAKAQVAAAAGAGAQQPPQLQPREQACVPASCGPPLAPHTYAATLRASYHGSEVQRVCFGPAHGRLPCASVHAVSVQ